MSRTAPISGLFQRLQPIHSVHGVPFGTAHFGWYGVYASNGSVRLLVLLTKADKLNRRESNEALAAAQAALGEMTTDEADVGVTLFSALNKTGVGDAAQVLRSWVGAA